jgi:hypothetical protein
MQELLRHSTIRSTLDVYTQAITPAKQNAQAAVMSLVFSSQRRNHIKGHCGSRFLGANWVQECTQFAPNFADFSSPNHPVSLLECMAGTTGIEPATSAVTVSAMDGSFWRFEARMVTVIVPLLCPRPLPF